MFELSFRPLYLALQHITKWLAAHCLCSCLVNGSQDAIHVEVALSGHCWTHSHCLIRCSCVQLKERKKERESKRERKRKKDTSGTQETIEKYTTLHYITEKSTDNICSQMNVASHCKSLATASNSLTACASASLYTATLLMPISLHVLITWKGEGREGREGGREGREGITIHHTTVTVSLTLHAISPLLATSILSKVCKFACDFQTLNTHHNPCSLPHVGSIAPPKQSSAALPSSTTASRQPHKTHGRHNSRREERSKD